MIIDAYAHVTAPDSLYACKAGLVSHRGAHGRGKVAATDDDLVAALNKPVFESGFHLEQLEELGTDLQIISPRPTDDAQREPPKLVHWYIEETNNLIAREVKLFPNVFRGVCGLLKHLG